MCVNPSIQYFFVILIEITIFLFQYIFIFTNTHWKYINIRKSNIIYLYEMNQLYIIIRVKVYIVFDISCYTNIIYILYRLNNEFWIYMNGVGNKKKWNTFILIYNDIIYFDNRGIIGNI